MLFQDVKLFQYYIDIYMKENNLIDLIQLFTSKV
jgi:hypothetical protein